MIKIEITPILLIVIAILPAIIVFLYHKLKVKQYQSQFKHIEQDNLRLSANVLDLEKEVVQYRSQILDSKNTTSIVRMDEALANKHKAVK